jgi:kinesin family member 2/24
MSVELYNQHTAISELAQVEDEMIDQLKLMADFSKKFVPELMDLCRMTNDPDYDQDGELKSDIRERSEIENATISKVV